MVVFSNVISVLLIAAVVAECWWLAHNTDYCDEAVPPPQSGCVRCRLDGIDLPAVGDPPTCADHSGPTLDREGTAVP